MLVQPGYLMTPAASTFSPLNVAGLELWLDASNQTSVTTSGSDVTGWADISGNGNNAVDAGIGQEPTLVTAGLNNLDVIDYTHASGDDMLIPAASSVDNMWDGGGCGYCVVRIDSDGGANTGRLLDKSGTNTGWFLDFREELGGFVKFNFKQDFDTDAADRYVGRSTTADIEIAAYHIVEVCYNSDSTSNVADVLIDGSASLITTAVTPTGTRVTDAADDLGIGGQGTGGTGVSIDGRVAELLLYSSIPTDQDRANLRGYLSGKWGIGTFATFITSDSKTFITSDSEVLTVVVN